MAFNDGITWADVTTTALFGSLAYDISDNLTASLELRRQEDDISEGNYAYERSGLNPVDGSSTIALPAGGRDSGTSNSGTFKSTLPRLILDWKPSEGKTIYASYSEGTRPGLFNSGLSDLSDGELAQIRTQTGGAGLQVDEEESENFELGIKTSFANGRGFLSASVYKTDISNLQTPVFAVSYTDDAGADQVISGSIVGQGATAKLSGLELEGVYLINEALKAEFTYAYNKSKIGGGFDSSDAYDLLGDSDAANGNGFSRYPEHSGSVSLDYTRALKAEWDLFARGDLIYTGKMYASQANLTHTGSGNKLNLRLGIASDRIKAELYCINCTDDDQPKGLQALFDFSGISGGFGDRGAGIGNARALSVALADKRQVGVRFSYAFGGGK